MTLGRFLAVLLTVKKRVKDNNLGMSANFVFSVGWEGREMGVRLISQCFIIKTI